MRPGDEGARFEEPGIERGPEPDKAGPRREGAGESEEPGWSGDGESADASSGWAGVSGAAGRSGERGEAAGEAATAADELESGAAGGEDGEAADVAHIEPVTAAAAGAGEGPGRTGAARGAAGGAGARQAAKEGELDDPTRLRAAVEAVLLVVDTPTAAPVLAQVLGRPVAEIDRALLGLQAEYDAGGRGMDLREVAEGWRLYSREDFAPYVERFVLDGQQARLTQASLETLAVIAYRQPVTRSRIAGIRGVSVDAVMRTLLTRGLVEECGADPDTGGGLYQTTQLFLEKVGLRSLDDLPSLAPLLPDTSQLDDVATST